MKPADIRFPRQLQMVHTDPQGYIKGVLGCPEVLEKVPGYCEVSCDESLKGIKGC